MKEESGYGATNTVVVASPTPTNVQVVAPATLEAGYTFDAMFEGVTFTVVVPDGGVSKGQRFIVPFILSTSDIAVAVPASSSDYDGDFSSVANKNKHQTNINNNNRGNPTGIWRDGLCDCCNYGPFHPHLWMSLCFRPFIIGQILTRMKMTWVGQRTVTTPIGNNNNINDSRMEIDERWKYTFRNVAIVTLLFYGITLLSATPDDDVNNQLSEVDKMKFTVNSWITSLFGIYIFYIMIQLRATIRYVYSIPEESCLFWYQLGICGNNPREGICGSGRSSSSSSSSNKCCTSGVPIGWEDICCALWCQFCIVGQMARHTANYGEKKAAICNTTGVHNWDEDEAYVGLEEGGHAGEGSVLIV